MLTWAVWGRFCFSCWSLLADASEHATCLTSTLQPNRPSKDHQVSTTLFFEANSDCNASMSVHPFNFLRSRYRAEVVGSGSENIKGCSTTRWTSGAHSMRAHTGSCVQVLHQRQPTATTAANWVGMCIAPSFPPGFNVTYPIQQQLVYASVPPAEQKESTRADIRFGMYGSDMATGPRTMPHCSCASIAR